MTKKELETKIDSLICDIDEKEKEIDFFELDNSDYEEQFRDLIDDIERDIIIGGISYNRSTVWEKVDPIAYNCGLNDYVSSIELEEVPEYQELREEIEDMQSELEELQEELEDIE